MKANLKIKGFDTFQAMIRSIAEKVPDKARKTMHRVADRVVTEAKLNTPVDEFNLEDSIRKEVSYASYRGRLVIEIKVGGMMNGVNVDKYAMLVHENYEGAVAPNGPGRRTKMKMGNNPGRYIGSKFLSRALEAERYRLNPEIFAEIQRVIAETKKP